MLDVHVRLHKNSILFGKDELNWSEFESYNDESGTIRGFWSLRTWLIDEGLFVDEYSALLSVNDVERLYRVLSTDSLPTVEEYARLDKEYRLMKILEKVMETGDLYAGKTLEIFCSC